MEEDGYMKGRWRGMEGSWKGGDGRWRRNGRRGGWKGLGISKSLISFFEKENYNIPSKSSIEVNQLTGREGLKGKYLVLGHNLQTIKALAGLNRPDDH